MLLAALVIAVRILLPLAEDYRVDAEQLLTQYTDQNIRISAMRAEWVGFRPRLYFSEVRLLDDEGKKELLKFSSARIDINIIQSIINWDFVPSNLTVSGIQLGFTRYKDGRVQVRGLAAATPGSNGKTTQRITEWFFRQPDLGIETSQFLVTDEKLGVKDLLFDQVYLRLRNDKEHHQIEGSVVLPNAFGDSFGFAIDMQGDLARPEEWAGEVYLNGRDFVVPQWLRQELSEGITLADGRVDYEVWGHWQDKELQRLEGNVFARQTQFAGERGKAIPFTGLQAEFDWRKETQGWSMQVGHFTPSVGDVDWTESNFTLLADTNKHQYQASIGFLKVGELLPVLSAMQLVDDSAQTYLDRFQPNLNLQNLKVHFSPAVEGDASNSAKPTLHIETDFTDLTTKPWQKLPGLKGLSGYLVHDLNRGMLRLNSKNVVLDYLAMFRDPLAFNVVKADVFWQLNEQNLTLQIPQLDVVNSDLTAEARAEFKIPLDGSEPFINAMGKFKDGVGTRASHYLPSGVLDEEVVTYLDNMVIAGTITQGGFVFYGPYAAFPYDNNEGRFEVRFDAENTELNYEKDWPHLKKVNGEVIFDGRGLTILAKDGNILDSTLANVVVNIPDLVSDFPRMSIIGGVDGDASDVLRYVIATDLGSGYSDDLKRLKFKGKSHLQLDILLKLAEADAEPEPVVTGAMDFINAEVGLAKQPISLKKVNGQVLFKQDALQSESLTAQMLGHSVKMSILPGDNKTTAMKINVQANLDLATLLRENVSDKVPQLLNGSADWQAELAIPATESTDQSLAQITVSSSLKGVSIDAPAPFIKPSDETKLFSARFPFSDSDKHVLSLDYGDDIRAVLELKNNNEGLSLQRGEVVFYEGEAALPKLDGLNLRGRIDKLSTNEWQTYVNKNFSKQSEPITAESTNLAAINTDIAWLREVDVKVASFTALGTDYKQAELVLKRDDKVWQFGLKSELISGEATIPFNVADNPVALHLDRLEINRTSEDSVTPEYDPRYIPAINLSVDQMIFDGTDLGKLNASIQRDNNGVMLNEFEIEGEDIVLSATGSWLVEDDKQRTTISGQLRSNMLSRLLNKLGYESGFDAGRSRSTASLNWSGNPLQFDLHNLSGKLKTTIRDGQLQDVSPGAGRVFGLLSLQSLPRRLTLDFSDVFNKGLSFDKIRGNFVLDLGDAYTTDLYLEGPAARIDISGRTGLAQRDYDQVVTVTPKLTSSLPIAGALVGGPIAGGLLFAVDKLFKPALDEITRYKYTITGGWDEPSVETLKNTDEQPPATEIVETE